MKQSRLGVIGAMAIYLLSCSTDHPEPVWKLRLQSRAYADPIADQEKFYVFSQSGEAISGKIKTGERAWSQKFSGPILGTPAISEKTIWLATQNGDVLSLNKETGSIQWRKKLEDQFIAPLSTTNDALLVPSESGKLYALSQKDGTELWRVAGQKKFNARAVVSGQHIIVGSWQKELLCLRLDGSLNWKFTAAEIITEEPVISENALYFGAYDHSVYSLEIQTGKLRWHLPAERPSNLVLAPAETGGNPEIVFSSGKDLLYVSPESGRILRRLKLGKIPDRLYVHHSNLYVIHEDAYRVNHLNGSSSVLIDAEQPIQKLSFASGMIIAIDDLYSIYGYATGER